jgi:uncharacterized protein YegP (UPF0339 family)
MHPFTRRTALGRLLGVLASLSLGQNVSAQAQAPNLRFQVYKDGRAHFRWRLKSANGQTIAAAGEGYRSKAACLAGIDLVRRGASGAALDDTT